MHLEEVYTKYKLNIKDIFNNKYVFIVFIQNKLSENNTKDVVIALLHNTAVMKYCFDTNTLIIKHIDSDISDIVIEFDSLDSKQSNYVIILRNLFLVYGVRGYDKGKTRNLMGEYFYLVYALLFKELVYR